MNRHNDQPYSMCRARIARDKRGMADGTNWTIANLRALRFGRFVIGWEKRQEWHDYPGRALGGKGVTK